MVNFSEIWFAHLVKYNQTFSKSLLQSTGGSRWVAKFLQESTLITFDFIWKVFLSDRNFDTLLDQPLVNSRLNLSNH